MKKIKGFILFGLIAVSSCTSHKQVAYLQNSEQVDSEVVMELSLEPTGRELCHLKMTSHNQWGATYSVNGGGFGVDTLWICNVTHDVLGEHPKDIYVQSIR